MSEPTIEDVKGDEVPERLDTRESQEKEKTKKSNKKKAEAKEKKQPIQEKVKQEQSDSLSDSDSKDGEPSESSSSVSEIEEKKPEPVILADGRIDLQGNNNVVKKIIQEGSGLSPEKRSKVKVHYTGTLLDGTKFDSSVDRGEPFEFELGVGQVIQGWDIGVASMKKGEISDLTLDPCVAYGERGSPPSIPANAVLVFHVELLDFQNDLVSDEEKIEAANKRKNEGNELVKQGKFKEAFEIYDKTLPSIRTLYTRKKHLRQPLKEVKHALLLNKALCALKLGDYRTAGIECEEVIKEDDKNTKALFRRGLAWKGLGEYLYALADMAAAARITPNDVGLREEIARTSELEKNQRNKEKAKYSNLFEKMKVLEEKETKETEERKKKDEIERIEREQREKELKIKREQEEKERKARRIQRKRELLQKKKEQELKLKEEEERKKKEDDEKKKEEQVEKKDDEIKEEKKEDEKPTEIEKKDEKKEEEKKDDEKKDDEKPTEIPKPEEKNE